MAVPGGRALAWIVLVPALAVISISALAARAEAGCAICDQYTLDIPPPTNKGGGNGGGGGGSGGGGAPEAPPAPAPAPTATTPAPAPAPAQSEQPAQEPKQHERKHKRAKPHPRGHGHHGESGQTTDLLGLPVADTGSSQPLSYEQSSAAAAALGLLGDPRTAGLLIALLAGAAIALAANRRRAGNR